MGQHSKTKNFWAITALLLPKTTEKKLWPYSHPQQSKLNGELRYPLSLARNEMPHTLWQDGAEKAKYRVRKFTIAWR